MDQQSKQAQSRATEAQEGSDEEAAAFGRQRLARPGRFSSRARPHRRTRRARPRSSRSTRASTPGRRSSPARRRAWAPRRELARVYKQGRALERLHRGDEGGRRQDQLASPEDKIPVLFEMIEVYRDRLKLDVMVVNAFNQILHHPAGQPRRRRRAGRAVRDDEALAGSDLAAAQEGGGRRRPAEKVALHLRGREPVPREVLQPGRGDQVLRGDPRARSRTTARRSAFLKQMYEKRRDWEKLVAVHQREIDKLTDAEERKAPPHRGGQAGLGEAEEAGRSRSTCGRRCSADDADERRGAGRAREAVRAREGLGRAGRRCWSGRSASRRRRRQARRRSAGQAGHPVHREGAGHARRRRSALAGAAGGGAGEPPRAGRARRSCTCSRRTGTRWRRSTPPQNKWDELVRVLERQAESEDDAGASACGTRSASCYRDRL